MCRPYMMQTGFCKLVKKILQETLKTTCAEIHVSQSLNFFIGAFEEFRRNIPEVLLAEVHLSVTPA